MTAFRGLRKLSDMVSRVNPLAILTVLGFGSLTIVSSAIAQELDVADPVPDRAAQASSRGETLRLQVPMVQLASYRRRAALADAISQTERAITDLQELLQEVAQERKDWIHYLEQIKVHLVEIANEIDEVETEIDDTEVAIAATLGLGGSVLIAHLESLKAELDSLREERQNAESDSDRASGHISDLEALAQEIEEKIEAKLVQRESLKREMAEVVLTAPSEGARLLVSSNQELRIRADDPPPSVRIEIQKQRIRSGATPEDPLEKIWSTVYDHRWRWRDLESDGSTVAVFRFKTVEPVSVEALNPDPETVRLVRGVYRARVQRLGPPHLDAGPWRTFSVVGRISDEILQQPAPRPGTIKLRPGATPRP
jgi:hypothetical protein